MICEINKHSNIDQNTVFYITFLVKDHIKFLFLTLQRLWKLPTSGAVAMVTPLSWQRSWVMRWSTREWSVTEIYTRTGTLNPQHILTLT